MACSHIDARVCSAHAFSMLFLTLHPSCWSQKTWGWNSFIIIFLTTHVASVRKAQCPTWGIFFTGKWWQIVLNQWSMFTECARDEEGLRWTSTTSGKEFAWSIEHMVEAWCLSHGWGTAREEERTLHRKDTAGSVITWVLWLMCMVFWVTSPLGQCFDPWRPWDWGYTVAHEFLIQNKFLFASIIMVWN
jgi:hypothetical protein